MKIHDKFVIELSEVIKGYGNDYQVEDPCRMPCDYKFYEINGVAICEESFKKMKRLEDEISDVLDKIRDKIMQLDYDIESVNYDYDDMSCTEEVHMICREEAVRIIDEYKAGKRGST